MQDKIIINADDFGISKGVNVMVKQMANDGRLNSVSIFAKAKHTADAIDFCKENKKIMSGLHFNLTTGDSVLGYKELPNLTNTDGTFKFGFIGLLISVFINKAILIDVKKELLAQLAALKELQVYHIDGHRHVHFIPRIFDIVNQVAKEMNIPRVRIINENPIKSVLISKKFSFLFDGGLVKLLILRICGLFHKTKSYNVPYFFSILYTCKITTELVSALCIPQGYEKIEIMIHPGDAEVDKNEEIKYEREHLLSEHRKQEADLKLPF